MRSAGSFGRRFVHKALLEFLVDPVSKAALELESCGKERDGLVLEGSLRSPTGERYTITNGIPRFVVTEDRDQRQTERSFAFKWQRRDTYDSPQVRTWAQQWFTQRYGFSSLEDLQAYFRPHRRILDAGCGSGFSSSLWLDASWPTTGVAAWYGLEISSAIDVASERLGSVGSAHFIQGDILQLPFKPRTFDVVLAEGVLHHTPSTERALNMLVEALEPGGELLFYVYRKKSPVREFTDDHLRRLLSGLAPEEAWARLGPLTKLGKALAELRTEVDVPEDVPELGIKAGRHDVQRLMYWSFAKLFWNEAYSFEENQHVNFDWYHPRYAHRHTEEEVRRWCEAAGLSIRHFDAQESGFTVRAVKS